VALDLPDGQPDMIAVKGEWQPVSDGRTLLRELAGHPVTVIAGIDPKLVVGDSNERQ
jgi:hypothetical protein